MPPTHSADAWYQGWWPFTEGHESWYRRWWPILAFVIAGLLAVSVLATVVYGYYRGADIPPADELRAAEPTVVYDAYGERIATLDPAAVRENVDLGDLPDHVWQAVLAAEDRGFYDHPGFSVTRIAAAFKNNVLSDDRVEGGSTISQQYVELAIREVPRTYLGKLREVVTAYKVEREYSKDQILEFYLNTVHFGRGTQGISAAARTYFHEPAAELSVEQAAMLAGMIAAPSRFAPSENPDLTKQRRDYTIRGMLEQGWVSEDRADEIIGSSLPKVFEASPIDVGPNAYYLDVVRDHLARELPDGRDPFLGLEVHTALDPGLQKLALDTLRTRLEELPYIGSIVSMDPRTGGVRVIIGGLDYGKQQFNVAVQGPQQPGSAFKPMTLTAFVGEGWSPQSRYDAPAEYTLEREDAPDYTVSNFSQSGYGRVDVRTATTNSINTVYVQMQQDVGTGKVIEYAHRLGIDQKLREVPSLTLGTVGVTPYEMASAYSTLAANGAYRDPYVLEHVTARTSGETLISNGTGPAGAEGGSETPTPRAGPDAVRRGVSSNTAAVVTDVLAENIEEGTGTAAQIGRPAAGKTGTTQEFRDAWFVGYVPQLTTAVWIGREDNAPMDDVTGGSIPAETWGEYMGKALKGVPVEEFPEPELEPLERIHEQDDEPDADGSPTATATATATSSPSPSDTDSPSPSETETGSPSPSPTQSDDGPLPTIDESRTNRS
ncbi:MAG: transglycosylase domain-containing protein, partial [Actinobacteria bacterium]|nr:transglycosylase domain-containing protein [Actinomycetota bacterium]